MPKSPTPKNLIISSIIAGTGQLCMTVAGVYIGATAASSTAGAIGLGIAGFVAGNIAGGIIGGFIVGPVITYNVLKAKKSSARKPKRAATVAPAPKFPRLRLKAHFSAVNKKAAAKALAIRKHSFHFGR